VRVEVGAAKARPGRLRRFASAVGAARRLPCDARSRGPVAELTALPAVASFGQRRRVRRRSALRARPRALCFSAPQRRAFACPGVPLLNRRCPAGRYEPRVGFAAGAARWGRFLGRREAQRQGRRAGARFVV